MTWLIWYISKLINISLFIDYILTIYIIIVLLILEIKMCCLLTNYFEIVIIIFYKHNNAIKINIKFK